MHICVYTKSYKYKMELSVLLFTYECSYICAHTHIYWFCILINVNLTQSYEDYFKVSFVCIFIHLWIFTGC